MASALCCTAEQPGRVGSPELPNARVSQATPATRPLLPQRSGSPSSRFTSARTEEIHELREIFDHADDGSDNGKSPAPLPRARFSRPSMQSLHSLRTVASLRSVIKQRFSRDWLRKDSPVSRSQAKSKNKHREKQADTILKQAKQGPNKQLQITKDDLRRDLLSDKNPDEGGYDSDAEVLDDIAKNVGKKIPGKRASIHSINWTPSTASKHTLDSAMKDCHSAEPKPVLQPYRIEKPRITSFAARFSHVFSTPNLRADDTGDKDRKVRRSHSASSMGLPKPSPVSPLRLPSLSAYDSDGVPWSEIMSESLRLSQFPVPPRHISPKGSEIVLNVAQFKKSNSRQSLRSEGLETRLPQTPAACATPSARAIEIRLQQPTSISTPRASTSIRGDFKIAGPSQQEIRKNELVGEQEKDDDPRRSVHLYSMRISHHLRSGSLLSWDQLADGSELPTPLRPFRERTVSDQSRYSRAPPQATRHGRRTSSSGFASSKVPSKWGKVVTRDDSRYDLASSIYSSRPHSPPESYGGSMMNLSKTGSGPLNLSGSLMDVRKPRRSHSFPTDNEDTPGAGDRSGIVFAIPFESPNENSSPATIKPLARKNSVAETKKSKFREEFSPSPQKRKLSPSASIIKFLNPKRLSMRSQSEANLPKYTLSLAVDGPFETLPLPDARERRQSRSLISLQAEQDALRKGKGADQVWDRALQAHREEKASLFMSKNKDQALHASPFRERSGSTVAKRPSFDGQVVQQTSSPRRVSTLGFDMFGNTHFQATPGSRRSALVGQEDADRGRAVSIAFKRQGDGTDIVGAWGRYPSHTRRNRTLSAGRADLVETRDFALEAAIRFASNLDDSHDDDLVDPTERPITPPLLPRQKKRKKRIGHNRMAKSNSMTFGKTLMKNYTKMFKSQSTEFRRHGKGHRSSVTSGGILEFPELELVPSIWTGHGEDSPMVARRPNHLDGQTSDKLSAVAEDSMATLRPRRNSSAPDLTTFSFRDKTVKREIEEDRARVWSVYYENCLPTFPRLSTDINSALRDVSRPARRSTDSKRAASQSRVPTRPTTHSRNVSQMSPKSAVSFGSTRLSLVSLAQDDGASDEKSVVSVRRSTMDLISKFKQQEATEHAALLTGPSGSGHQSVF